MSAMNAGSVEHAPTQREINEIKRMMTQNVSSRPANRRDDTPDHHTVGNMVNLLANDMEQLAQEIGELRGRLAPILADRNNEKMMGTLGVPASCKVAAELGDVYQRLSEARRLVQITIGEIDL